MSGQMALRMRGLRLASDPFVVVVIYIQIAFAFLWDTSILGTRPNAYQVVGAAVIVVGSVAAVLLRARAGG